MNKSNTISTDSLSGITFRSQITFALVFLFLMMKSIAGFSQNQTLTTSGTFIVPGGVTSITISLWGGGGGGGTNTSLGGGGGGGGGFTIGTMSVTPGQNITYIIGAGGNGATTNGGNGQAGGNTTFSTFTANGGGGGLGNSIPGYGGNGTYSGGGGSFGNATNPSCYYYWVQHPCSQIFTCCCYHQVFQSCSINIGGAGGAAASSLGYGNGATNTDMSVPGTGTGGGGSGGFPGGSGSVPGGGGGGAINDYTYNFGGNEDTQTGGSNPTISSTTLNAGNGAAGQIIVAWACPSTQTFTSSGTFTVPDGITSVSPVLTGGGGGGATNTSTGGGGGGGGGYTTGTMTVTPGQTITFTVGAGGAGATTNNTNGQAGGNTTFSSFTAHGGGGGLAGGGGYGNGGAGGTGTYNGGYGSDGQANNPNCYYYWQQHPCNSLFTCCCYHQVWQSCTIYEGGAGGAAAGSFGNGNSATNSFLSSAGFGTGGGGGGNGPGGDGFFPGGGGGAAYNNYNYNYGGSEITQTGGSNPTIGTTTLNAGSGAAGKVVVNWTCPTYTITSSLSQTNNCNTGVSTVTVHSTTMPNGTCTVIYKIVNTTTTFYSATMTFNNGVGTFTTAPITTTSTVTITTLTYGCCASNVSTNNVIAVTISGNSLPAPLFLVGSSICATPGGNGTITTSFTTSGINYQLYSASNAAVQTAQAGGSALTWSNLSAGTGYYVIGTNGTGCTSASNAVNVATNANPTPSISGTNPFCSYATSTLDAGSYTNYSWDNASTSEQRTVATSGTYSVTVTDVNSCTGTASLVVTTMQCNSISCSGISAAYCAGISSTINYTAIGVYTAGNVFTAELSDATGHFPGTTVGTVTATTSGSISITIPSNGTGTAYRIRVNSSSPTVPGNDNGANSTINTNPTPAITETDASGTTNNDRIICNGGSATLTLGSYSSYLWSNGATTQAITISPTITTTYYATVTDNNTCTGVANATVTVKTNPVASSTAGTIACYAGTASITVTASGGTSPYTGTGIYSELVANPYSYTVTDVNGCTSTTSLTLTQPTLNTFTTVVTNNTSCTTAAQGSIAVTASGGTGTKVYSKDNGVTFQGASLFSSLANGSYIVSTKDANNCPSGVANVTLASSAGISFTTTIVNPNPCATGTNGKITVVASGGSGYFNYSKNGGAATPAWQSSNVFTALVHGTYSIKVKDVLGCLSNVMAANVGANTGNCREEDVMTNSTTMQPNSFSIYPNPATNQATILFNSSSEEKYSLTMVDVTGRTILNTTNTSVIGDNQFQINLIGIARGIYMVVLQNGDGTMQKKIVVE